MELNRPTPEEFKKLPDDILEILTDYFEDPNDTLRFVDVDGNEPALIDYHILRPGFDYYCLPNGKRFRRKTDHAATRGSMDIADFKKAVVSALRELAEKRISEDCLIDEEGV